MIKISVPAIAIFSGLTTLGGLLAIGTSSGFAAALYWMTDGPASQPSLLAYIPLVYAWIFVLYRILLAKYPFVVVVITPKTKEEMVTHVYLLFYLVFFMPIIRTNLMPTPLMRQIYLVLGARLGDNTYSGGALLDPPLTVIGDNSIVGHDAVVFAHVIEGDRYAFYPVTIGNNVTIGTKAVIMPGVCIDDDAIVCAGAVVTKNSHIAKGEIWGGVPAKKITVDAQVPLGETNRVRKKVIEETTA